MIEPIVDWFAQPAGILAPIFWIGSVAVCTVAAVYCAVKLCILLYKSGVR